jgi:hypothetical protein
MGFRALFKLGAYEQKIQRYQLENADPILKRFIFRHENLIDWNQIPKGIRGEEAERLIQEHILKLIPQLDLDKEKRLTSFDNLDEDTTGDISMVHSEAEYIVGLFMQGYSYGDVEHDLDEKGAVYDTDEFDFLQEIGENLSWVNRKKNDIYKLWKSYMSTHFKDNPAFMFLMLKGALATSGADNQVPFYLPYTPAVEDIYTRLSSSDKKVQIPLIYRQNAIEEIKKERTTPDKNWLHIPTITNIDTGEEAEDKRLDLMWVSNQSGWCTSKVRESSDYLIGSDFFIFAPGGTSQVAVRKEGDSVAEIRGKNNDVPISHYKEIAKFIDKMDMQVSRSNSFQDLKERYEFIHTPDDQETRRKIIKKLRIMPNFAIEHLGDLAEDMIINDEEFMAAMVHGYYTSFRSNPQYFVPEIDNVGITTNRIDNLIKSKKIQKAMEAQGYLGGGDRKKFAEEIMKDEIVDNLHNNFDPMRLIRLYNPKSRNYRKGWWIKKYPELWDEFVERMIRHIEYYSEDKMYAVFYEWNTHMGHFGLYSQDIIRNQPQIKKKIFDKFTSLLKKNPLFLLNMGTSQPKDFDEELFEYGPLKEICKKIILDAVTQSDKTDLTPHVIDIMNRIIPLIQDDAFLKELKVAYENRINELESIPIDSEEYLGAFHGQAWLTKAKTQRMTQLVQKTIQDVGAAGPYPPMGDLMAWNNYLKSGIEIYYHLRAGMDSPLGQSLGQLAIALTSPIISASTVYRMKTFAITAWITIHSFRPSLTQVIHVAKKEIIDILQKMIEEVRRLGGVTTEIPFIPLELKDDAEVRALHDQVKQLLQQKEMEKESKNSNWYKTAQIIDPQVSEIAKQQLEATGWSSADCKTAFGYDICVFKNEQSFIPDIVQPPIYQIGIQKVGRDFGQARQQYQQDREPFRQNPNIMETLDFLKTTLEDWLNQFGELIISSHQFSKTKVYIELLRKLGFNVTDHTTTDPYTGRENLIIGIVHP